MNILMVIRVDVKCDDDGEKKSSIERAQLDTRLHHSTLDCLYWSNCETFGQITQQTH